MKFLVNNLTKCAPRTGTLAEIHRHPQFTFDTPMPMLYTRGGSIPHITNEVFKLTCKTPQIIQIPLVSTYNFEDAMAEYTGNIAEFVGMQECVSCLSVQDPGDYTQPGHRVQDQIPLWTRQGKVLINSRSYMNSVEHFKPDMYYLLSDSDTNAASSAKRINKAVGNTVRYFKECIERHKKSVVLKNSFVMAPVAGGYSLQARKECLDQICGEEIVGGYLIDGLHNNGPEVEFQSFSEIEPVVQHVINSLPENKIRAIHGCWNPLTVIELVKLGMDLFDTSYCYILTERSAVLTFSFNVKSEACNEYELNLRQQRFADDFKPILQGCECLACEKYTKGYIHHLVTVQELLGPLLLMIHNVHHYLKFFEAIRECIQEGTLDELKEKIAKQFNVHQDLITKNKKQVAKS